MTTPIRISRRTLDTLRELAHISGLRQQQVLEEALELYRRKQLLKATDAAYGALREDADTWQEVESDRAAWDATLFDGLEDV